MEEAIDILKKIGVKEINKTTKISVNKIEDILEKRFSNVQRVRVVGFLKILEREYKVDLSSWLKEYDERFFVEVDTQDDGRTLAVEHPSSNLYLDTQKQKDDLIEERKKQLISKKRFYALIAIVVIIVGGYLVYRSFFHHSTQIAQETEQSQEIQNKTQDDAQDIDKLTQAASESENSSQDENPLDVAQNGFDSKESDDISPDVPTASTPKSQAPKASQSYNSTQKPNPAAIADTSSNPSTQQTNQTTQTQNELAQNGATQDSGDILIIPKKSLWIEIINLSTKERKQTIIQDNYSIKTGNDSLLISFGHGELWIQNNDEKTEYDKSYPLRFLYTPKDGLKQIRYSKYLELSGQEQ